MLWKEVRDLRGWFALAMVVQLYLAAVAMGLKYGPLRESEAVPFLGAGAIQYFFFVALIFAAVAGLWQTLMESLRGTYAFLLHRPAPRSQLFGVKLLVGGLATLVVGAFPVLIYALWAATPGTHASPFFWEMSWWAWNLVVAIPMVYLGAFLSGLRPARWFGSMLFPLAATGMFAMFAQGMLATRVWPLGVPLSLAIEAALVAVILQVAATRDYS
jgi:ABC-type transport system involved in multi-copper enzyme maturation permease subunit